MARSELPVANVRELVAYAKKNPGNTTYSSSGIGTANQLAIELLAYKTGTKFLHIPYKSDTQSASEIMAGRIDFSIMTASVAIPLVQSGRMKAFAVTSPKRLAAIPNVPSLMEAGLPGLDALEPFTFYGIVGAAGLPPAVVQKLNAKISEALGDPAVVAKFTALGFDATAPSSPEQFGGFIRSELTKWRDLSANVKIDFK
ncbi:MAG: tripartite tricarboxylate transporter substrate-binding protein [Burkholderiaceae bacterium]|nr:tripartite tricarboxylate transporter substrate-binding protein [Burkholderiaceae bacterium]